VPLEGIVDRVVDLLVEIQEALLVETRERREAATADVTSPDEVDGPGMFRIAWDALGETGEDALAERGYTVRCLVRPDGELPQSRDEADLLAYVARAY
jgi:prolyl-tRNA synthetase